MYICIRIYIYICIYMYTASPPTKSSGFRGFDSNKLLILRGGNYHILYRESPGKSDSRTLSRKTLSRWTGWLRPNRKRRSKKT